MARWRNNHPTLANQWVELAGTVIVVGLVLLAVVMVGRAIFGSPAGAEPLEQDCTRPYHNLTPEQLPNICTVQFDGQGHATLAGFNPDTGLVWHAASFHVPNPENWPDQTTTVDTTLPVGPFNLTLACQAGAAQVDVWLDGFDDAYVAAITYDCVTPCFLDIAVPVPDTAPSVERHDDAPCGVAPQLGAPSGQTGPDISTPVLSAATETTPTDSPPVGVVSSAATTLPNTGISNAGWLLLTATGCLVAAMVLIFVGPHIFRDKGRRS